MRASILSSKTYRDKLDRLLAEEIAACDTEGMPPVPVFGTGLYICKGMLVDHQELYGKGDPIFGMAGFATYDDIIGALSAGRGQTAYYNKASQTTVATNIYALWQRSGMPPAGTFGTSLAGRAIDNTFAAAMQFANPAGGLQKHLLGWAMGSTVAIGSLLLYDRVYEYPFTGTATSGTFSVPGLVARDAAGSTAGEDLMMFLENFSATATAAVTVTPTYTDQAGNTGNTNAFTSIATAALAFTIANPLGKVFLDLASGDSGVRSIQSYTLSASLVAANMCFVLGRPLGILPMLSANAYVERDTVLQIASLPRLYDGTALSALLLAATTTCPCFGEIRMAEN